MDYILTIVLLIIGIAYHVMQTISKLRNKFPDLKPNTIWSTFFLQEWDSLIVSFLGVAVFEVALFVIKYNAIPLPSWLDNWGIYAFAAVWGYAGQRLAYKFLNTGEVVLEKKSDQLNNL